jgi:UDP-N-acetylglucosamine/UDP-N-acetylgalactosamine diphosphorylase
MCYQRPIVMDEVSQRALRLVDAGVDVVDPRQTYVAPDVVIARIRPGARLFPGTRLHGARTFIAQGAQIGSEGPATVVDAAFGKGAGIDSGYVAGAVLLPGARLGANAHVRPGTLLEEGASTAHAVGLKQTILLSFVTLGSLINFCDVLMAGGTSRTDHSEVGSGFIHFNFTPWGKHGDKATPSLVGDVVRGVLLREPRIFLGGAGGMVGPRRVGFGAIAAAGQVLRRDVDANVLSLQIASAVRKSITVGQLDAAQPRGARNVEYIGQLVALRQWYREVRLARATDDDDRTLLNAAIDTLGIAIAERVARLGAFLEERGLPAPTLCLEPTLRCPIAVAPSADDHVAWVRSRDDADATALAQWLASVASGVATTTG